MAAEVPGIKATDTFCRKVEIVRAISVGSPTMALRQITVLSWLSSAMSFAIGAHRN
jgi:hypothetical protein